MWKVSSTIRRTFFGNSRSEVFSRKCALRNFAKFTGKHLCQSLFFNKVAGARVSLLTLSRNSPGACFCSFSFGSENYFGWWKLIIDNWFNKNKYQIFMLVVSLCIALAVVRCLFTWELIICSFNFFFIIINLKIKIALLKIA